MYKDSCFIFLEWILGQFIYYNFFKNSYAEDQIGYRQTFLALSIT